MKFKSSDICNYFNVMKFGMHVVKTASHYEAWLKILHITPTFWFFLGV